MVKTIHNVERMKGNKKTQYCRDD